MWAGVDIGSLSAEAVIMNEGKILSYSLIPTGAESAKTAQKAMEKALEGEREKIGSPFIDGSYPEQMIPPKPSEDI